jgi:serine/threonine protein kinase
MGEVYRARNRKLDRDVAIKVLPELVAKDPVALARFEREAKAVAALSHPNILAIHDFGTQDGTAYAITELLEGETLRGKLDDSVSQRQVVEWALQIAKGLRPRAFASRTAAESFGYRDPDRPGVPDPSFGFALAARGRSPLPSRRFRSPRA